MRNLLTLAFVLFASFALAQESTLEIFSKDILPFKLYMNGKAVQDVAESNVKVNGLTPKSYFITIVFDDARLAKLAAEITVLPNRELILSLEAPANPPVVDANGVAQPLVYRVFQFSNNEIAKDAKKYVAPEEPIKKMNGATSKYVNGIKVPVMEEEEAEATYVEKPPISMNVDFESKTEKTVFTQKQITTTKTSVEQPVSRIVSIQDGSGKRYKNPQPGKVVDPTPQVAAPVYSPPAVSTPKVVAPVVEETPAFVPNVTTAVKEAEAVVEQEVIMPIADCPQITQEKLNFLIASINAQREETSKLELAQIVIKNNCVSIDQIKNIMSNFNAEGTRLAFAKYAYPFCVNKANYRSIRETFTLISSKDSFSKALGL